MTNWGYLRLVGLKWLERVNQTRNKFNTQTSDDESTSRILGQILRETHDSSAILGSLDISRPSVGSAAAKAILQTDPAQRARMPGQSAMTKPTGRTPGITKCGFLS